MGWLDVCMCASRTPAVKGSPARGQGAVNQCMSDTDGWMDGWMGGWMDGWMDGWIDGSMGGWIDGWVDGWMDGWVGGWMGGWVGRSPRIDRLSTA